MDNHWFQSEAAATLLAVILGAVLTFVTTAIANKNNRKYNRLEQIRKNQIDSIKQLVHIMQSNDSILDQVEQLRNDTLIQTKELSSSAQKKMLCQMH